MLRLMIKLGLHGKRHNIATQNLSKWMHEQGLGA